jgi:hypothetical protein
MTKITSKKINIKYLLLIICFFLLILIFRWINFLTKNNYLKPGTHIELFNGTMDVNTSDSYTSLSKNKTDDSTKSEYITGKAIDMPYFANYTCKNWCGPRSQCLFTREQCTSDADCGGCQDLTAKNNMNSTKSDIYNLGQSFMDIKGFHPRPASEDILENEYIHFSRYTKQN